MTQKSVLLARIKNFMPAVFWLESNCVHCHTYKASDFGGTGSIDIMVNVNNLKKQAAGFFSTMKNSTRKNSVILRILKERSLF